MAIKLLKVQFKWKNCKEAFIYSEPTLFSTGGGSYQAFGYSGLYIIQKHFYFFTYCFLSIKYLKDYIRKFHCRVPNYTQLNLSLMMKRCGGIAD